MFASVGRGLVLALATALCSGCARADYPSPVTPTDQLLRARIDSDSVAISHGGAGAVVSDLGPVVDGEDYAKLSEGYRHEVDELLGSAALSIRNLPLAEDELRRASQSTLATDSDRLTWLKAAQLNNDFEDAYAAFQALKPHAPGFENALGEQAVSDIDQGLGVLADPRPQREWERYLDGNGWRDRGGRAAFENVRFNYAAHLLDDGHAAAARAVAQDLTEPDVLVQVTSDRRFDAIRAIDPSRFDPVASTQRRLERFETKAQADPSLEWETAVASEMMRLGRLQEALDVLQKAMPSGDVVAGPNGWARDLAVNQESYLLFALGQRDEALGIAEGAGCNVCGPNVDPILIQAAWLIDLGRGREALARLNRISDGDLVLPARSRLAASEVCAATETDDKSAIPDRIAYLKDHRLEDPWALVKAELCLSDLDAAAAATASGLENPRERDRVLQRLQLFLPLPDPTPWQNQMSQRLDSLRSRPDVAAAVAKVGRIQKLSYLDTAIE